MDLEAFNILKTEIYRVQDQIKELKEKVSCWDCNTELKRVDAVTWWCEGCQRMWKLIKQPKR